MPALGYSSYWLTPQGPNISSNAVACSYDGQYLVAGRDASNVLVSYDGGTSMWITMSALNGGKYYACSQSGQYMYSSSATNHAIYLSTTHGGSWQTTVPGGFGGYPIICSADGNIVFTIDTSLTLEYSSNYGNVPTPIYLPENVYYLAGSATCQYIVVAGTNYLLLSNDTGSTWQLLPLYASHIINAVSMSSTGQIIL